MVRFLDADLAVLLQLIADSGCIACLAEVLRDYSQMTDMVLSETSAALAVLAASSECFVFVCGSKC